MTYNMEIAMMVSVEILVGMSNFIIGCCAAKTGPCTQLPQHLTIRKGVVIKRNCVWSLSVSINSQYLQTV